MIFAGAGYGKTEYIKGIIAQRLAESADEKILLLVAEQISFESEREILRLVGPRQLERVDVLSFSRFCDRLFESVGGLDKRRIDNTGRTATMELAARSVSGEMKLFSKVLKSPDFSRRMLKLDEKCKRFAIAPDELMTHSALSDGVLKTKLYETALLLTEYNRLLNEEYYDPLDNISRAVHLLDKHNPFEGRTVIFDSFNGFTAQQLLLVEKILCLSEDCYITLCFDGFFTNDRYSLFSNVAGTAQQLKDIAKKHGIGIAPDVVLNEHCRYRSESLKTLEAGFFRSDRVICEDECEDIAVFRASTKYEECDFVAGEIRRLIREEGFRRRDFAVITRDIAAYGPIIENAMRRCDIPCFIDCRRSIESMALFKLCGYALSAAINRLDAADVIPMLKTGLCGFDEELVGQFDNYVTIWKITRDGFRKPFTGHPEGLDYKFSDNDKKLLSKLNSCREATVSTLDSLQQRLDGGTARAFASGVYEFVKAVGADKAIKSAALQIERDGDAERAERERRSYEQLIAILDQLVMAAGNEHYGANRLFEIYTAAVAATDIGTLPQGLDEVSIGAADRMRPKSPRVTFIIGAASGLFPAVYSGSDIFTENELKQLNAQGVELPCYNERTAVDEDFLAYTAVCSPSERLYLSFSSGSPLEPQSASRIITDIEELFPQCRKIENDSVLTDRIESIDSAVEVYARTAQTNPVLAQEIAAALKNAGSSILETAAAADAGRLNTRLTPETAKRLFGENLWISASRIDTFYKCSFSYFCNYGLKARPLRIAEVDNLQRGSMMHFVLERLLVDFTPEQLHEMTDAALYEQASALCNEFSAQLTQGRDLSKTESFSLGQLALTTAVLTRIIADGLLSGSFRVCATELKIGDGETVDALRFTRSDGSKISLSGSIDRVDLVEQDGKKYLRVVDYKSNGKTFSLGEVLHGQNLQMLIYMMALLADKSGNYGGDSVPAGIMYQTAKLPTVPSPYGLPTANDGEKINKLKPNGIFLNDEAVFEMTEHGNKNIYSPIKLSAAGTPTKSTHCYTQEQFELIARHIKRRIINMGESLLNGDISINPMGKGACIFCDCADVCRYSQDIPAIKAMSDNEFYDTVEKEELQ